LPFRRAFVEGYDAARLVAGRVATRSIAIGMTDTSHSGRAGSTLNQQALLALLATAAAAILVALVLDRTMTLESLQHAVTPLVGFLITAPLGALASALVLARSRGWRAALGLLPAQLGLAWLTAAVAMAALRLPSFAQTCASNYHEYVRLEEPEHRQPGDLGPDLPFLEAIRGRLRSDRRTLVLTESFPLPDLPVILYPVKESSLTLKVNPHPEIVARLRARRLDAGGVPTDEILDKLHKAGLLVPWRDLEDPMLREYLRGFDAIIGLNVGLPLETLADFEVAVRFDARRQLLVKKPGRS
jgi:hypothetical protein